MSDDGAEMTLTLPTIFAIFKHGELVLNGCLIPDVDRTVFTGWLNLVDGCIEE